MSAQRGAGRLVVGIVLLAAGLGGGVPRPCRAGDAPPVPPTAAAESDEAPAPAELRKATPLPRPAVRPAADPAGSLTALTGARSALPTIGSLLAVLGTLWFALHAAARFRRHGAGAPEAVACVGQWQVAGKHPVYLLHIGSRLLLLSGAHDSLACLTEITDPAEVAKVLRACPGDLDEPPPALARFVQQPITPSWAGR